MGGEGDGKRGEAPSTNHQAPEKGEEISNFKLQNSEKIQGSSLKSGPRAGGFQKFLSHAFAF
jgi:hypothetical protein